MKIMLGFIVLTLSNSWTFRNKWWFNMHGIRVGVLGLNCGSLLKKALLKKLGESTLCISKYVSIDTLHVHLSISWYRVSQISIFDNLYHLVKLTVKTNWRLEKARFFFFSISNVTKLKDVGCKVSIPYTWGV